MEDVAIAEKFVEAFPELRESFEVMLREAELDGDSFGVYDFSSQVLIPELLRPALDGHDPQTVSRLFEVAGLIVERDRTARNFVEIEICEAILSNREWYDYSWGLMPESLKNACVRVEETQARFK